MVSVSNPVVTAFAMTIVTIWLTVLAGIPAKAQSEPPEMSQSPFESQSPESAAADDPGSEDQGPVDPAGMDELFRELAAPDSPGWQRAESDILREWSRSGSASMDLLLKRGEAALDAGDVPRAIDELTALTDHAPEFAAGWQARAAAFAMSGEWGPAASDLARTLALEPRQFAALTQLGAMLEEMGDLEGALNAYRASLEIHPRQQEAIDGAARLEEEMQGTAL